MSALESDNYLEGIDPNQNPLEDKTCQDVHVNDLQHLQEQQHIHHSNELHPQQQYIKLQESGEQVTPHQLSSLSAKISEHPSQSASNPQPTHQPQHLQSLQQSQYTVQQQLMQQQLQQLQQQQQVFGQTISPGQNQEESQHSNAQAIQQPLIIEQPLHPNLLPKQQQQSQSPSQQLNRSPVTTVKLASEANVLEWFAVDVLNQLNSIANKAKESVDQFITVLDPGMKDYLFSGGDIDIKVISERLTQVKPVREAYQDVFGRATVIPADINSNHEPISSTNLEIDELDTPRGIVLANGVLNALDIAQEKILMLRGKIDAVAQNQVIMVIQPTLIFNNRNDKHTDNDGNTAGRLAEKKESNVFLAFCLYLDDPVSTATFHTFTHYLPLDNSILNKLDIQNSNAERLGFNISTHFLAKQHLYFPPGHENYQKEAEDDDNDDLFKKWTGVKEHDMIHSAAVSLAMKYKRLKDNVIAS